MLVLSALMSCNQLSQQKTDAPKEEKFAPSDSEFGTYLSSLDNIPLPLNHNPLGKLPDISQNYERKGFERFRHTWTTKPLGIYYHDGKTVGIIDCSVGDWGLVPFLTTYDLEGNKIDSTGLHDKSGIDMGYDAIEHLSFYKDRRISVVDTVRRWEKNQDGSDLIEGSMKMTSGKTVYRILENGQIEKDR